MTLCQNVRCKKNAQNKGKERIAPAVQVVVVRARQNKGMTPIKAAFFSGHLPLSQAAAAAAACGAGNIIGVSPLPPLFHVVSRGGFDISFQE